MIILAYNHLFKIEFYSNKTLYQFKLYHKRYVFTSIYYRIPSSYILHNIYRRKEMDYNFGEIDQLHDYFINLNTDQQKYCLYLMKHSCKLSNMKDYVSRIDKIKESMSYQFVTNKEYHNIPGSSNFIACNGRYIINDSTIERILKDIKDVYLFNKRSNKFKDMDIDRRLDVLNKFMHYLLNENKIVINDKSIESYVSTIDEKDKHEFLKIIKWYSEIKNIDLTYDEEEIINKKNELGKNIDIETQELDALEKQYLEKLEKIKEMKKQYVNL